MTARSSSACGRRPSTRSTGSTGGGGARRSAPPSSGTAGWGRGGRARPHGCRARVIGIGSSRNRDFVLGLGADEYVDYTQQDVSQAVSGVDVAFDAVGGETTAGLVPTLREGGRLVTIANAPPEEAAAARGAHAE